MTEESTYTVSTVRRRRRSRPPELNSPVKVYDFMRPIVKDADREHFYSISLNARNQVISADLVSVGSLNASIVHPREVFRQAIKAGAASIVICHNHPSGESSPSQEDIEITGRLIESGDILGIQVLDHVILGKDCYESLKETGAM